nr:condensation domain-containing protein [Gluconacetobacter tumulisoli]
MRDRALLPRFYTRFGPSGSTPHTNLVYGTVIRGVVDVDALRSAVSRVVEANPELRAFYSGPNEDPAKYSASSDVPFHFEDCRGDWVAFKAAVRAAIAHPFSLTDYPLIRVTLVRRAPARFVFILCAHHLAVDGWSIVMFLRAISRLYQVDAPASRPAVNVPDYLRDRQAYLESDAASADTARALAWLAPAVPALRPTQPTPFPSPEEVHRLVRLDRQAVRQACQTLGLSVTDLHRVLFVLVQHAITGLDELGFSEAHPNRPPEGAGLYGFLSDDHLVRVTIRPGDTVRDLVDAVKRGLDHARDYAGLPAATLLRRLYDGPPLPRFHFNPFGVGANALRLGGLSIRHFKTMKAFAQTDLTFVSLNADFAFIAMARPEIDGYDIDAVATCLRRALAMLADPTRPLSHGLLRSGWAS